MSSRDKLLPKHNKKSSSSSSKRSPSPNRKKKSSSSSDPDPSPGTAPPPPTPPTPLPLSFRPTPPSPPPPPPPPPPPVAPVVPHIFPPIARLLRRAVVVPVIPLPFVLDDGTDLGMMPVTGEVISSFEFMGIDPNFLDVTADIDRFVYGDDFTTVIAPMTEAQRATFRVTSWVYFQNSCLVPAVNRMIHSTGKKIPILSAPQAAYTPQHQQQNLTPLEFFATNLFTKDTPGNSFFSVLNRVLLGVDRQSKEVLVNMKPYDNDKKIFNVWFYLFLSGLNKLLLPVPAMHQNYPGSRPTVRLFRGLGVNDSLSKSLWKPPHLHDSSGSRGADMVNVYSSLGFSSLTTSCDVACKFASNFASSAAASATHTANVLVFEPSRGRITLPSLRSVSDVAIEDEFLMFPNFGVTIYSRETGSLSSQVLGETCDWSVVLANDIAIAQAHGIDYTPVLASMPRSITWIAMTDVTGATSLSEDIEGDIDESGGRGRPRRHKRKIRAITKHRSKSARHLHKKTSKIHNRKH